MQPAIDIHSHLLPGVDDGAASLTEALEQLQSGLAQGVEEFILTPHLDYFQPGQIALINTSFAELTEAAARLLPKIRLHLGAEIRFTYDLFRFIETRTGLFGTRSSWLLLEFDFLNYPPPAIQVIQKIQKSDIGVIIAHPERIRPLANNRTALEELRKTGAKLQLNAGSLTGLFGRDTEKAAWDILTRNQADFIASDAHRPQWRPFALADARKAVAAKLGAETADRLFYQNQKQLILK